MVTMATQSELTVEKELHALKRYAESKGLEIQILNPLTFVVKGLPATDGCSYAIHLECDDYPIKPPIFKWCNPETLAIENSKDIPNGDGGFFHASGTPCVPWNRNSYKEYRGDKAPHGDWTMEGWQNNSKTGQCTTIPRMIVKLCAELQSQRHKGKNA